MGCNAGSPLVATQRREEIASTKLILNAELAVIVDASHFVLFRNKMW